MPQALRDNHAMREPRPSSTAVVAPGRGTRRAMNLPATAATAVRPPTAARLLKEQAILAEAEKQFAQFGFEGASLESIAIALGTSRHNLLYYFPSKEMLYRQVLDDVLMHWLAGMDELSRTEADPRLAVRRYIHAKMRSSRERPNGAKVFATEVIAGAPRFGDVIVARVGPKLRAEVRAFQRWAREGKIARVDFTHLMFCIWSMTQAYADQQAQFALLLGKPRLESRDYEKAADLIGHLVWSGLQPNPQDASSEG